MSIINRIAILIDAGFFEARFKHQNNRKPNVTDVEKFIKETMAIVDKKSNENEKNVLLRTFYYDCYPYEKSAIDPNGKKVEFANYSSAKQKIKLLNDIKFLDQFALRLGKISFTGFVYDIKEPKKFKPNFSQKGVDMKIGLDMAWIAGKKSVNKMVLVTGDSDFISPMKLVRREGVLVYLFPMGMKNIKPELREHSDFILKSEFYPDDLQIKKENLSTKTNS